MESFALLCMAVCGIYMCRKSIAQRVHGRFYGLDFLKRGNGRHGKLAMDTLDLSTMKKMAVVSNSKGKKLYTPTTCVVNSCQERLLGCYSD